jgi:hypothetical protein
VSLCDSLEQQRCARRRGAACLVERQAEANVLRQGMTNAVYPYPFRESSGILGERRKGLQ